MRMSQLEELMANTMKAVDKLTADMQEFREYAHENNKVVNSLLRKMDDRDEEFRKFEERQEKYWKEQNKKWEDQNKKWEDQNKKWDEQSKRWEKQDKINDQMIQTLVEIRNSLR